MYAKHELLSRLQQVISEQLGVEQQEITEYSAWLQLGADSLDRLQMTRAVEDEFKVEIPHAVGERLNTVGQTVDHLLILMAAQKNSSDIRIEPVTTNQQWAEMLGVRTRVFAIEYEYSIKPLPGPGEPGVWHFLARDDRDAVGALSVVDTTGNSEIHQRYRLKFGRTERVARYAQLAILKPYRKRGIFEKLIEAAQGAVIRPHGFAAAWLLYPETQARSSKLTQHLGFSAQDPVLATEFGKCRVMVRRESASANVSVNEASLPVVETCPI